MSEDCFDDFDYDRNDEEDLFDDIEKEDMISYLENIMDRD